MEGDFYDIDSTSSRGFILIELLVVLGIVALLLTLAVPRLRALRSIRSPDGRVGGGGGGGGLLYQPGGNGIIGIHSLSQARPLKTGNFEAGFTGLEGRVQL